MDTPSLDGVWLLVRAEHSGEEAPEMMAEKTELELTHGDYLVRFGGQVTDRGTFELGGTLEMKTMVLHGTEGPNAGRTIPCIYQFVGDRLRVCYGLDGITPNDFTTAHGQHRYLALYRRER